MSSSTRATTATPVAAGATSPEAANPTPAFSIDGLTVGYGEETVLHEVSAEIPRARSTVIIGPNACGKSTLLKTLARLLTPSSGEMFCDGEPLSSYHRRAYARKVGLLPQSATAPAGITVLDLIRRGRTPHASTFSRFSKADENAVAQAVIQLGLDAVAHRPLAALSGGQRQRAWIGMVLAQDTDVVLLDEPTTFLDIAHQYSILNVARDLRDAGKTVVTVLHDINQAARYADHLIVMKDGRVDREGPPAQCVTEAVVRQVYDVECQIVADPYTGGPIIVPSDT